MHVINTIVDLPERKKQVLIVSVVLFVLGSILIISPGMKANWNERAILNEVAILESEIQAFSANYSEQVEWFAPEYTKDADTKLGGVKGKLAVYKKTVQEVSNLSVTERISVTDKILGEIGAKDGPRGIVLQVKETIRINKELKEKVRIELDGFYSTMGLTIDQVVNVEMLIRQRQGEFLSKYQTKLANDIAAPRNIYLGLVVRYNQMRELMPEDGKSTGNGDPKKVEELIKVGLEEVGQAKKLAREVEVTLNYYVTAVTQAKNELDKARQNIQRVLSFLDNTVLTRKFSPNKSLSRAYSIYAEAVRAIELAYATSETIIESGKPDLIESYRLAKESQTKSDQAWNECSRQVDLADVTLRKNEEFVRIVSTAAYQLEMANNSFQGLNSLHGNSEWSTVQNHYANAQISFDAASRAYRLSGDRYVIENFEESAQNATYAVDQLGLVAKYANELADLFNRLEGFRKDYPNLYNRVANVLNSESVNVSLYRSYDSGAASDFDTAVRLLNESKSFAAQRLYKQATDRVNQALVKGEGTGLRAYQAKVRSDEEEAEAARRRNSQSSSFSPGMDMGSSSGGSNSSYDSSDSYSAPSGGGSNSSDSYSSPSDGGGYDQPSSSDDGGGW